MDAAPEAFSAAVCHRHIIRKLTESASWGLTGRAVGRSQTGKSSCRQQLAIRPYRPRLLCPAPRLLALVLRVPYPSRFVGARCAMQVLPYDGMGCAGRPIALLPGLPPFCKSTINKTGCPTIPVVPDSEIEADFDPVWLAEDSLYVGRGHSLTEQPPTLN